jgi:ribonuclease-3
MGAPSYVVEDDGPDHAKTFTAAVVLAGTVYGHGAGRTKKAAEQEAAETAWRALSDPTTES